MKRVLVMFITVAMLLACSSPLDKVYTDGSIETDGKELETVLDSTELMLLAGSIMAAQFTGDSLEGMTYREILEKAKEEKAQMDKERAEEEALAEKERLAEAERMRKLKENVRVTVVSKGFHEGDFEDQITMKFSIQNRSDKEIRAVKGTMKFTDLFDDEIKSVNFVYDDPIPANGKATWNGGLSYNPYMGDEVQLKEKDLEDLKVIWEPESIIFADGSKLE